jgi:L-threonylcarbamoyladenylate synthase
MSKTIIEKATRESIAQAAAIIRRGGLVAFPTETVYGLGANGLDNEAAARIYAAKGRPADNPLILHIAQKHMVYDLAAEVSSEAQELIDAFWPGALTLILPKRAHIPYSVSCGLSTVGIRMPSHPVARELILEAGLPLAAPSANSSGRPSPTLAEHVAHDLDGKIDMILDGGAADWGLESTVAEITQEGVCVLRPGAVTIEQLRGVIANVWIDAAVKSTADDVYTDDGFVPKSPGMKYRHYSPEAQVILVTGNERQIVKYILDEARNTANYRETGILATEQSLKFYKSEEPGRQNLTDKGVLILTLGDRNRPETLAANLFGCLRRFDELGVRRVYAEGISEQGLGLAVMNRLTKAAATVIEL